MGDKQNFRLHHFSLSALHASQRTKKCARPCLKDQRNDRTARLLRFRSNISLLVNDTFSRKIHLSQPDTALRQLLLAFTSYCVLGPHPINKCSFCCQLLKTGSGYSSDFGTCSDVCRKHFGISRSGNCDKKCDKSLRTRSAGRGPLNTRTRCKKTKRSRSRCKKKRWYCP